MTLSIRSHVNGGFYYFGEKAAQVIDVWKKLLRMVFDQFGEYLRDDL